MAFQDYYLICLFRVGPDFDWSLIRSSEIINEMMSTELGGGRLAQTVMVRFWLSDPV